MRTLLSNTHSAILLTLSNNKVTHESQKRKNQEPNQKRDIVKHDYGYKDALKQKYKGK